MSDPFKLRVESEADLSGVDQAEQRYDAFFARFKEAMAVTLKGEGASPQFIDQALAHLDEVRAALDDVSAGEQQFAQRLTAAQQKIAEMAEAEQRRISQLKVGFEQALAEKAAHEEMLATARRRREEDKLAAELEELASKKRIAALQLERELARSVAEARQMNAEINIRNAVMGKGAYDPSEEVERLRQVERGTDRVTDAHGRLKRGMGEAAMQAAYFFDDMQYGIRGVLNNIPMLLMSLGAGAGVTGVVTLAAIAVNFLWDKFSGAKEAAQKTEEAQNAVDELKAALDEVAKSSQEAFEKDLSGYLEGLREATQLWSQQKGHIQEALTYQNELAKAETDAAQARLEIERQTKLGGAKSDSERASINADFDLRGAQLTRTGQNAAMQRAIDAQKTSEATVAMRIREAEQARQNAEERANKAAQGAQANPDMLSLSDEAGRQSMRTGTEALIRGLEAELRKGMAKAQALIDKGIMGAPLSMVNNAMDKTQLQLTEAYKTRDRLNLTKSQDEEALKTGKVTYDDARKLAKETGNPQLEKAVHDEEQRVKQATEERAKIAEELKKMDEALFALKLEQNDVQKRAKLLEAQKNAMTEKQAADDAKRQTEQADKERKEDEAHLKKLQEREQLAAENNARDADKRGDHVKAAEIRNKAALEKIGGDAADPEDLRKAKLDNYERMQKARDAQRKESGIDQRAKDIGGDLDQWTRGAPKAMQNGVNAQGLEAVAKALQDGTDKTEIAAAIAAINKLGPLIVAGNEKRRSEIQSIRDRLEVLASQIQNANRS